MACDRTCVFRDVEISQHRLPVLRDENILELQIAVDDLVCVQKAHSLEDVVRDAVQLRVVLLWGGDPLRRPEQIPPAFQISALVKPHLQIRS